MMPTLQQLNCRPHDMEQSEAFNGDIIVFRCTNCRLVTYTVTPTHEHRWIPETRMEDAFVTVTCVDCRATYTEPHQPPTHEVNGL